MSNILSFFSGILSSVSKNPSPFSGTLSPYSDILSSLGRKNFQFERTQLKDWIDSSTFLFLFRCYFIYLFFLQFYFLFFGVSIKCIDWSNLNGCIVREITILPFTI